MKLVTEKEINKDVMIETTKVVCPGLPDRLISSVLRPLTQDERLIYDQGRFSQSNDSRALA